jgi:hypothetical protein
LLLKQTPISGVIRVAEDKINKTQEGEGIPPRGAPFSLFVKNRKEKISWN